MKRFKQSNKNIRFAKEVKEIAKKYGAKNFNTYSGYFLFSFSKHSVIHFVLPNNYKIGVWLDSKDIFAEHLVNIDKFKPTRTEFDDKFESIDDIKMFIDVISKIRHDEYDNELKKALHFDRTMYQYIIGLEGVEYIALKRNDSSFTYNDMYSMDICVKANSEDEAIELSDKIEDMIKEFYKINSKEFYVNSSFEIILGLANRKNIRWFYKN